MIKIKEKIFEDLYTLDNGMNLHWNRITRSWKMVGSVYWDGIVFWYPRSDYKIENNNVIEI